MSGQNSLEKLDVVWSSVKDSSLKNYEYILLRHLLGDKQDNLLSGYKKNEKKLLPLLQQTAYCKEHMGKSITLVPSQIENIVRGYLNGNTPYRISKNLGISKTSVNKILSCDYRTVNSLKKILDALHSINGNWGPEKKKELDNLISNYEIALKQAEEKAEILRNDIDNRVVDINGYFHEINGKQK